MNILEQARDGAWPDPRRLPSWLERFRMPLFLGVALKAIYDLTLLLMFRGVKPLKVQRFTVD